MVQDSKSSPQAIWQELDLFFMQRGKVYETLQNLSQSLSRAGIDYAVIGGMALVIYGYVRATQDVDLLLSREGLDEFKRSLVGRGFVPAFPGANRMFRDTTTGVTVEILITGEFPGDGKPKPISFPDPAVAAVERDGIQVIQLTKLIELKLASGLSAADRLKDLADVQELIRVLNLPIALAEQLDESIRPEYSRLWSAIDSARKRQSGQEL
ncbi:nucleotidyltransferase family protein [Kovacikia minuta CCNUW1]|uniref:nucleotidyltransferase family protein n=1 Tax=Kovacikia minuta TaxID=2931930 RepID=UPI001CCA5DEF|nr:nucleotidyltransferase family protein [Kovacikia minuta]UBF28149.1 nucleotidyltransferase family protein [Kovacikia minuta CCNUW1]